MEEANPGEKEALDKAEKLMSSSKFPAFLKIMQWAYVRPGGYLVRPAPQLTMLIEREIVDYHFTVYGTLFKYICNSFGTLFMQPLTTDFARKYFKDSTREVKIEVSGKTWTAGVRKDCATYRLTRCWSYLVTEQALKVGDVCAFELINTEDYTLKLTIFSSTS